MFFPERIVSIKPNDRVLEVGPGASPHPRSDVLLEKNFSDEELLRQNGYNGKLVTEKKTIYYSGERFPFEDNEFDYVICSHVLEHIPEEEFELFIQELQRVAKRGYIEFPIPHYDYIYSIDAHVTLLFYEDGVVYYTPKKSSDLEKFSSIQSFFNTSLKKGYTQLVDELKDIIFQGYEWEETIEVAKIDMSTMLDKLSVLNHYIDRPTVIDNKSIRYHLKQLYLKCIKKILRF